MCTIMTFTSEMLNDDLLSQIIKDNGFNSEGTSILLDNNVFLSSMNIDAILTVLKTTDYARCWLHQRAASTATEGLAGCHGFWNKDRSYMIFHNGVIRSIRADELPVDSMVLPEIVDTLGLDNALEYFSNLDFANVFTVHPDTGSYYVTRGYGGSLYTDNMGNYSTNPTGSIMFAVPIGSYEIHEVQTTKIIDNDDFRLDYDLKKNFY